MHEKMRKIKTGAAVLAMMMAAGALPVFSQDMGLIIPMPGKKEIEKASAAVNIKPANPQTQQNTGQGKPAQQGSEVLINLPTKIKPVKPEPKPQSTAVATETAKPADKPLITIEPPKPEPTEIPAGNFPTPPDEVTISSGEQIGDLLPPAPPPEVPVSNEGGASETLPVFPKDTSSAIFMVMKTWQAQDYDGATLLKHAVETYGKEADDVFQIQGLTEGEEGFKINVEEEDITLDELLDIIAMKSGRDWGVDIPSRIIYFYPKGVKTDNYNVW
ncbi:MAG TPA: hypothetical protein PLK58_13585 [Candidatus Rifleibacterium sp.]|nr:hypothetical protein [Candidatus Rifleibacterium sp.]